MAKRLVTLADIVAGHVSLEIEGFDRIINGQVPALQTSGQVAGWLHYRGFPIASPAALGKNKELAVRAGGAPVRDSNRIPWIRFTKAGRKIDVTRPYLDAAEQAGVPKVVAIGRLASSSGFLTPPGRKPRTGCRSSGSTAPSGW